MSNWIPTKTQLPSDCGVVLALTPDSRFPNPIRTIAYYHYRWYSVAGEPIKVVAWSPFIV